MKTLYFIIIFAIFMIACNAAKDNNNPVYNNLPCLTSPAEPALMTILKYNTWAKYQLPGMTLTESVTFTFRGDSIINEHSITNNSNTEFYGNFSNNIYIQKYIKNPMSTRLDSLYIKAINNDSCLYFRQIKYCDGRPDEILNYLLVRNKN